MGHTLFTAIEYHPCFVSQFQEMSNDIDNLEVIGEINALTDALDAFGHDIEGEGDADPSHPIVTSTLAMFASRRTPPSPCDQENEMNTIPEASTDFSDAELLGATAKMAELRRRVLDSDQGRAAYQNLASEIDGYVELRRARLGEVRRAVGLTQEQVAATLGIGQAQVSKIERSVNLQLETLERFITATGGRLRVVATYDDIEIDIALDELAPATLTEADS